MADTLPARNPINLRLKAGEYLQFSGSGELTVSFAGGDQRKLSVAATAQIVGPVAAPADVAMLAGATAITYTVFPAAPQVIVVDSAAPVNTDGRPEGTIYIQTA